MEGEGGHCRIICVHERDHECERVFSKTFPTTKTVQIGREESKVLSDWSMVLSRWEHSPCCERRARVDGIIEGLLDKGATSMG